MKTRYRIVHSRGWPPYLEVEAWRWWWPFWTYVKLVSDMEEGDKVVEKRRNPVIKVYD